MSIEKDERDRQIGQEAAIALPIVGHAVWQRSAEIISSAAHLHDDGELTPAVAHSLLISLLEQRKLLSLLDADASAGVRAARRIDDRIDREAALEAREKRAETHGKNRFMRSRVGA